MAVTSERSLSEGKVWSLCRMPFWHSSNADGSSSSSSSLSVHHQNQLVDQPDVHSLTLVSSVAKSFLPTRRRLSLDPPTNSTFPVLLSPSTVVYVNASIRTLRFRCFTYMMSLVNKSRVQSGSKTSASLM
ncbi:unnamed protein product [Ilex paraguariensis]|uniref:Uncharacterized protein n=1 Tax=Ilex paraguariensis TaxID=185542 RepID=A0ABC8UHW1_9AQUA